MDRTRLGRIALGIAVAAIALAPASPPTGAAQVVQPVEIPGVEYYPDLPRYHIRGPGWYPFVPPPGGPHAPVWQNCGVYEQPVPIETALHSLEHGAVWITYWPGLSAVEVLQLRALARGQTHVLVNPWFPSGPLPSPIVASAWGLQLKVDSAFDPRLAEFVRRYANGPQNLEPGAPCSTGGVGTPLAEP
jgi:hypothetical protein